MRIVACIVAAVLLFLGWRFFIGGGCENYSFQNDAKKLLILQINEMSQPKTLFGMGLFGRNAGDSPALNAMKTKYIRPESVKFSEVQDASSSDMSSDYSQVCTATAKITLREKIAEKLRKNPVAAIASKLNGNEVEFEILYTKEEKNGDTLIGAGFQNPMMAMMLSVALQSAEKTPEDADKKEESTSGDADKKEETTSGDAGKKEEKS
jgi:hypothetical protein